MQVSLYRPMHAYEKLTPPSLPPTFLSLVYLYRIKIYTPTFLNLILIKALLTVIAPFVGLWQIQKQL